MRYSLKKKKKKASDLSTFKINARLEINVKNGTKKTIIAPKKFSIIDNSTEIIPFFENMKNTIYKSQLVFLDMTEIDNLTIETILYILAIFEFFNSKNIKYSISGNIPKNKECAEILLNSGFYKYVKSKFTNNKPNDDFLQIESNNIVCGGTAKQVMLFIIKHLKKSRIELQDMREILIELMNNSVEHAYRKEMKKNSKWYLMAKYDSINENIKFSFLDIGEGIPNTVNRNHKEKIKMILDKIVPLNLNIEDSFLIQSALDGEFRSETKQGHRGKGLPTIYEASKGNYIRDLIIFANKGYVNCANNYKEDIVSTFKGTLFTWKYIK